MQNEGLGQYLLDILLYKVGIGFKPILARSEPEPSGWDDYASIFLAQDFESVFLRKSSMKASFLFQCSQNWPKLKKNNNKMSLHI